MMAPTNPTITSESDDSVRVECQYDDNTPPSIAIVKGIATIEDIDPENSPSDLGLVLYNQIDPETLNRLVAHNTDIATVTVDLALHNDHHYAVQIRDTGKVVVQKPL